jgi:serine/threonine protein kinase
MKVYCTRPPRHPHEEPHLTEIPEIKLGDSLQCAICGMPLILDGRYVPIKKLGQGGFGYTFLASDLKFGLDSRRAIKQFRSDRFLLDSEKAQAKSAFEQEWRILDRLKHPQIPKVYEPLEVEAPLFHDSYQNTYYYFVQEYIEGDDLQKILNRRLQNNEFFSEKEVQCILGQILALLEYVHQSAIIHRDIKPSNIIQTSDGICHLIDFGNIKKVLPVSDSSRYTNSIGTPGFTPPEQFQGRPEFSSDLYALAKTCICLFTGDESSLPPWRSKILVSRSLSMLLTKMTTFDPKGRYRSVMEVQRALKPQKRLWNWISGIAIGIFIAFFAHFVIFRMEKSITVVPNQMQQFYAILDQANQKLLPLTENRYKIFYPPSVDFIKDMVDNIPEGTFEYGGSTTWEPLSGAIDELINKKKEQFKVSRIKKNWSSEKGVKELRKKDAEISFALSSKPINRCIPQEDDCNIHLMRTIIAETSKVMVVHKDLAIDHIKLDDLEKIRRGKIQYWDDLKDYSGLPHEQITYYTTDAETYITKELKESQLTKVKRVETNEKQFDGIANDKGGITVSPVQIAALKCSVKSVPIGKPTNYLEQKCVGGNDRKKVSSEYTKNSGEKLELSILFKDDQKPINKSPGKAYATILLTKDGQEEMEKEGYLPHGKVCKIFCINL